MNVKSRPPSWPLALLAAAGFLLSGYLWFATGGVELPLCPAGGGCQVVQSSPYAYLFGVPLPVYGLVYYGTLLVLSGWGTDPALRWQLARLVSAAGSAASVVFLGVQRFVLQTFCPLCVLSALLSFALFGLSWWYGQQGLRWPQPAVAAVAVLAFVLGGYAVSERQRAAGTYAEGLAKHLARTGAVFYGAYWCPHCAEQKRLFGTAARYLPYVECDPRSPEGNPRACETAGVRAYPTWVIQGRRYEGVLTLEELARRSGYPPP
ncbi:MAG: vitamin K epoxide reductase family protein [Armatimonadetes bacterium]|nr:vitamin K epoxide reductase family protein [Armatimonadota bacterium]MDW8154744.1 vitamin K epoxide reductase family protein [Armatimonadota bacterium]